MSLTESQDPALDARDLDLRLLQRGLFVLVVGVVLDFFDLRVGIGSVSERGVDVLHDVVAALCFLMAARAIAQPSARAEGVAAWAVWGWAAASLLLAVLGAIRDLTGVELALGWPRTILALLQAFGFVALCVSMRVLCAMRGLASSERWRRVAIELVLLVVLPLILWIVLRGGVPLEGADDAFDRWVRRGWVLLQGLALFDLCLASLTTARSAARRI